MAPITYLARRAWQSHRIWSLVLALGLIWLLLSVTPAAADDHIVYVKPGATGSGSSWDDATGLQSALTGANNGDEIWVASGVYTPGVAPADTFRLQTGVALYGGFTGATGTEGDFSSRDWQANLTVLSGDIDGNDTTDAHGVVTDTAHITGTNAYHVLTGSSAGETGILDGFTVTAGSATGDAQSGSNRGGGLYNFGGSPTLVNVSFIGNTASNTGGGMANYHITARPTLVNVKFVVNTALNGGGMANLGSRATLTNATFSGNVADYGGGIYESNSRTTLTHITLSGNMADYGGGVATVDSGIPTLTNVTFTQNIAGLNGGGMYNGGLSRPTLIHATFSGNRAASGGGMMNFKNGLPTLINVAFSGNTADFGGGMMNADGSSPALTNVTMNGNTASTGGAVYNNANSVMLLQNTVVWGNHAATGPSIANNDGSSAIIRYSLVQSVTTTVDGNLDGFDPANDPQFVRAVGCGTDGCGDVPQTPDGDESANDDYGDLRLQGGSSAIDIGDNDADLDGAGFGTETISEVAQDLGGNPRLAAVRTVVPVVDLGAYERGNAAPVFTSVPPTSAIEASAYSYTATTEDDTLGIRPIVALTKPNWLDFVDHDDGTAILSGTPVRADVGEHVVVLRARDAIGVSGFQTFTLSVGPIAGSSGEQLYLPSLVR